MNETYPLGRSAGGYVQLFTDTLARFFAHLSSVVGSTATAAVLDSARWEAAREHPVLHRLEITSGGVGTLTFWPSDESDPAVVVAAGSAYLAAVLDLLTDLTGDLLVRRVEPLVREFERRLEEVQQ